MSKQAQQIQVTEKQAVTTPAEQTRPGLVFTPAVDIYENAEGLTLLADLPGVRAKDVKIDLREGVLTLEGPVTGPEAEHEEEVLREFRYGGFVRQFTLADSIDQGRIEAKLTDGVLELNLPKVAAAKPRQIEVRTA